MARILLLNGPNLNLLGRREPERYGSETLEGIVDRLADQARKDNHELVALQSNDEATLVERIQQAPEQHIDWIIFNPAAFTHTSVALRDALLGVGVPFIEVHISNIYAREPFRQQSHFSDIAAGVIAGFGTRGYDLALEAAHQALSDKH